MNRRSFAISPWMHPCRPRSRWRRVRNAARQAGWFVGARLRDVGYGVLALIGFACLLGCAAAALGWFWLRAGAARLGAEIGGRSA